MSRKAQVLQDVSSEPRPSVFFVCRFHDSFLEGRKLSEVQTDELTDLISDNSYMYERTDAAYDLRPLYVVTEIICSAEDDHEATLTIQPSPNTARVRFSTDAFDNLIPDVRADEYLCTSFFVDEMRQHGMDVLHFRSSCSV